MKAKTRTTTRVILWAAVGLEFLMGVSYAWSVISKALVTQYGWTNTQASAPYMCVMITSVITMIFAGRFQDKHGPRVTTMIGALLIGSGLVLSAFAKTPFLMLVTVGFIFGSGMGFCGIGLLPTIIKWFPSSKRGFVTGLLVGGCSISPIVYAPLINWIFKSGLVGVSGCFLILGIGTAIFAVLLAQLINAPSAEFPHDEKSGEILTDSACGYEYGWLEMLHTKQFYLIWVMLVFSSVVGPILISQVVNIAFYQAKWEGGYILVAILAISNTGGRLLGGILSDRVGRTLFMRVIFGIQIINLLSFRFFISPLTLATGVVISGFCFGTGFAIMPAITADYFGSHNLGVNIGIMSSASGIGGVVGPLIAGLLFDSTGAYNGAYNISAGLMVIGVIISLLLKKPKFYWVSNIDVENY